MSCWLQRNSEDHNISDASTQHILVCILTVKVKQILRTDYQEKLVFLLTTYNCEIFKEHQSRKLYVKGTTKIVTASLEQAVHQQHSKVSMTAVTTVELKIHSFSILLTTP